MVAFKKKAEQKQEVGNQENRDGASNESKFSTVERGLFAGVVGAVMAKASAAKEWLIGSPSSKINRAAGNYLDNKYLKGVEKEGKLLSAATKYTKWLPWVGHAVRFIDAGRIAHSSIEKVENGDLEGGVKNAAGGFLGLGVDTAGVGLAAWGAGLLGLAAGWPVALGGVVLYTAGQGVSYITTGKSLGENVGEFALNGIEKLIPKTNPDNTRSATAQQASEPVQGDAVVQTEVASSPVSPSQDLSSLRGSIPPAIVLPGGAVIPRGSASLNGIRSNLPKVPSPSNEKQVADMGSAVG